MAFEVNPKTPEELRKDVEANGAVKSYRMEVLRDLFGFKKLGIHVRPYISKQLAGVGLGHTPTNLPDYQEELVRVFKLGSPVAELIHAATTPGEAGDATLRNATGDGGDAETILVKIRELVGAE